jgi:hypothetical protein
MASADTREGLKPPPKFVTNEWAWAYTLDKLEGKGLLDDGGNPTNYGAAVAIYKRVAAKYGDPNQATSPATATLTRAEIISLEAPQWVVGRGGLFVYSATDEAIQRLYCEAGGWKIERTQDDRRTTYNIDRELVDWLLRDAPFAQAWVVHSAA